MIATEQTLENLTLTINQEIHVKASLEITFAALLEQLGPGNETPDGKSLQMKIEPWPGGRWYRDLGDGNGHFWAHVQAIKRPTLLEFAGPLFASFPFVSNVQYRLVRSRRRHLDQLSPQCPRIHFRRAQGGHEQRLGLDGGARSPASRGRLGGDSMCPLCVTTVVLIAGSVTSTGGLAAVAIRKFGTKSAVDAHVNETQSKEDRHG